MYPGIMGYTDDMSAFEITAGDRTKPGILTLCPDISLQRIWKISGHFLLQSKLSLHKNNVRHHKSISGRRKTLLYTY